MQVFHIDSTLPCKKGLEEAQERKMKKRIDPEEKIVQRSIGFNFRQIRFFNEYPDFKPDTFCRVAVDNQIMLRDTKFLKKEEEDGHN